MYLGSILRRVTYVLTAPCTPDSAFRTPRSALVLPLAVDNRKGLLFQSDRPCSVRINRFCEAPQRRRDMPVFKSPIVLLLAASILAACFAVAEDEPSILRFDGGFQTDSGVLPVTQTGVRLTAGRSGSAAEFVKGAVLTYPTDGVFDTMRGTLDLWVRPNWDSAAASGDRFFWGVDNTPDDGNRTVLGFLSRDGKGVVYFGGDGALGGLSAKVDWRAGEWHRITICWDDETPCRTLYIDGTLRHHIRAGGMPRQAQVFHVGSLPCVTRWTGVPDGHEADASIDDVSLSRTADAPGFDRVRLAAAEDGKAQTAFENAREQARPAYETAWERLQQGPTLEGVAASHTEVQWEDLVGLAAPMTQRLPVQARYHPDVILMHPDLSIALGRDNDSFGLGFALGDPFRLPSAYKVTRSLHRGYQPILESEWDTGACVLKQTALALLPRDEETVTGREMQYLVVRVQIHNTSPEASRIPLLLPLGRMQGSQNTNYAPFLGSASRWMEPPMNVKVEGDAVSLDGKALLVCRSDAPAQLEYVEDYATGTTDPLLPAALTNCLRCTLDLPPGQAATLDLITSGSSELPPVEEFSRMRELTYEAALARSELYWERGLAPGMKLTTPEPHLNDIYRHLILSCLGNVTKEPDRPWHIPYQFPGWDGVWPWECAHMVDAMCSVGFHKEMEPTLRYFTERQTGLGKYEEPGRGPEGDVKCTYGCYTGNFLLRWMNETGSILWALASKYAYSGDDDWLRNNKDSILAAWDWILGERARTRRFTETGEKVLHYGLLPRGRVHDWNDWHHFFFSDVFSWKGMDAMAAAFRQASFPEAERLTREADEYRQCLLDAVEKAQFTDPDTGLLFVPNLVYYGAGERGGLWWADGPSCMFSTGLLDAGTDARFDDMFQYLERTWGTLAGLTNRMDEPKELGKKNPFWYVNSSERGYFQNFLARGEVEKALLVFYSNLVYGMSNDCFQTVERIHVSDANYAPFQPNASGNGRLLDMFRRMVVDDQEPEVIWLLRGCPRRWFAPGQSIAVENAPVRGGTVGIHVQSEDSRVVVDIDAPSGEPARELRLMVRRAGGASPSQVTVNGEKGVFTGETIELGRPTGHVQVICTY